VLEALVGRLLSRMPLLLRVLDNIALLDMLLAFFQAVGGACVFGCVGGWEVGWSAHTGVASGQRACPRGVWLDMPHDCCRARHTRPHCRQRRRLLPALL
jgi:hypothetical protein